MRVRHNGIEKYERMDGQMREVKVEQGKLRGIPCGWPGVTVFYGIPYAAPPVGELRWRPPKPAMAWEGVRDCARGSARCWQLGVGKGSFYEKEFYPVEEEMSEDCLYLNVWTPARAEEEKLPVIFWVHGGAFLSGYGHSAHFDGEHFARQGVILVTINYRLNIFGWMVHPELSEESGIGTSGNYGLLDQIAALRWVRRNITAFGGDPENITLAGQSAGACCVQALICSPLTRGMYARAIMQSGGGASPFPDMEFPSLKKAEEMTALRSLSVSSIEEARKLTGEELLRRWERTMPDPSIRRGPVVDGYVLKKSMADSCMDGDTPQMPCLIGYTGREGLVFARDRQNLEKVMEEAMGSKAAAYLSLCPENGPEFEEYQSAMATELLQSSAEAYAELRERQGKGDTYIYSFERMLPGDDKGPFHAADLWYVFKTFMRSWRPWEGRDYILACACNTYWANFAKYGTPNGDSRGNLPWWEPYTKGNPVTLRLDKCIELYERSGNSRVLQRKRDLMGE